MMANIVGKKSCQTFLNARTSQKTQTMRFSYKAVSETLRQLSKGSKVALALGAAAAVGVGSALQLQVSAVGLDLHPPHYPWPHKGIFKSFDHASIRRGWQVYKEVCAACHSIEYLHYRDMVGVCMTEAEAKAEAQEAMVTDGPDANGEMFQRPGKLSDTIPPPYPNEQAAMAANNGAYPPDLSLIAVARHGEEDYLFSLLTGYCDPPPGMEPMEDLHYNPYFSGSWINMAQALYNEIIEYEDGTPATQSQLAKDVSTFLRWSAEPEAEARKKLFLKVFPLLFLVYATSIYFRRHKVIPIRSKLKVPIKGDKK